MAIINENRMFGDIFKELRMQKKESQDATANNLDVSQPLIAKWENHLSTPSPEMLDYIADYFQVSTDYLIGRSNYKNLETSTSELDKTFFSKAISLNDDEKKTIIMIMDTIHKDIDKEI